MKDVLKCGECGCQSMFISKEKGEVICRDCGLVIEESMVDFGKEWSDFDDAADLKRRSGPKPTFTEYDQGFKTQIGSKIDLNRLGQKDKRRYYKLRKWQNRTGVGVERNLQSAMVELKRMINMLKLTKAVEEEAARIYTIAVHKEHVKGRNMDIVMAACVYAASKICNNPRSLDDVCLASDHLKKEVSRSYRLVMRVLNLPVLPSDPVDFVPKIINEMKLTNNVELKTIKLLEEAQKKGYCSGRNPVSLAAGAIYLSALECGERITQRILADSVGITEVTVRNRYTEFLKMRGKDKKNIYAILNEAGVKNAKKRKRTRSKLNLQFR